MENEKHTSNHIQMSVGDVAYVKLPEAGPGVKVANTISLRDLVENFKGSDVELDFSEDGVLIGIEILALGSADQMH